MFTQRRRLRRARNALLSTFEGPWGLKASEEDAVLAVICALYPEFPKNRIGIELIRQGPALSGVVDTYYNLTCGPSLSPMEIVKLIVPLIDNVLGEQT